MSSSPAETPSVGLIGAGAWGRNWARCLAAEGALALVVDTDRAALAAGAFSTARTSTSLADALADPAIDKIVVATPAESHFAIAEAALGAGKHVLVEKPLCLEVEQARRLIALARASGRVLMVGHLLRYHPCIIELGKLVQAGSLGPLLSITASRLNLGRFRAAENALWSFAPHDISVILGLLGGALPRSLRCWGSAFLREGLPGATSTMLRFPDEVTAQIHVSWLNPFKEQKLTVVGAHAMVVFDDTKPWAEKLLVYRDYLRTGSRQEPALLRVEGEAIAVEPKEPLLAQCRHFLESCQQPHPPLTDGEEGLRVLRVLEMAQQSLEAGGEEVSRGDAESGPVRDFYAHPSAIVAPGARVGAGTKIWSFSQVMSGAVIGAGCSFGQNVNVAGGAVIGDRVKVQNNVSIYDGVEIEDDVFLGPSCVLTNVSNPRAAVDRRAAFEKTRILRGATVGANATVVCGVTLGRFCFVAAGAVVVHDVPDYALVMGNPARQSGWMSEHGHRLERREDGSFVCPVTRQRYALRAPNELVRLDDALAPGALAP